jgi:hypothetical protein
MRHLADLLEKRAVHGPTWRRPKTSSIFDSIQLLNFFAIRWLKRYRKPHMAIIS